MKEKFQNPQTVIRWLFAGFTVICLLAAVLVSDRGGMLDGLVRICTQSGQTVKSYFDPSYGGFSGTFLNVALVCAVCLGLYCLPGSKPDGVSVLAFFLTAGFCFWGTTILNIWFSFAGVLIYCLVMKKKPGAMANAFLFSTGLAPLITEMLFNYPTLDAASASGFTLHGILLALAGGFMDAYSYMARGHVFANAQTGNILLFAVAISEGRPADSLRYLLPVVSFALGIALAAAMRTRFGHMSRLHWRQLTLLIEILILFGVSFFPAGQHLGANSLTSLACGIQVQAFRKIEGNGIATTMCIGNLRAGVQALHEYHIAHDREELRRGALYFGVILFFALGAVAGNLAVDRWGLSAIRWDCLLLVLPLLMMLSKPDESKEENK